MCERAWTRPRSRARCAAVQPALRRSAEVTASSPTSRRSSRHQADGLDRLGRDRAGVGDDDLAVRSRLAQPVGAVDDALAQLRRHLALDLLDRPRREAQIDRAAGLVAQPVALGRLRRRRPSGCSRSANAMIAASSSTKAGSNAGEPVLRHADQRLRDRLVRAAFRRQRDAGRRRHQNEARILVAGVVERIEAARDERIVQRADRQQPLAVDRDATARAPTAG